MLVVVGVVAVSSSAVLLERSASQPDLPASVPFVDQGATPAKDCLFILCESGVYRAALSVPMTFSPQGLVSVSSDSPEVLVLTDSYGVHGLTVAANPHTDRGVDARGGPQMDTALALADRLAHRSDLRVSPALNVTLAGRPGVQLDITAAGDDTPVLFTAGSSARQRIELGPDEAVRLTLIDVPGSGTVAVLLRGPTNGSSTPQASAWRLEPLMASLAFGTS